MYPMNMLEKKIGEIDFRKKYNILILTTIKKTNEISNVGKNISVHKVQGVASADLVLEKDDILVLYGANKDIQKFLKNY